MLLAVRDDQKIVQIDKLLSERRLTVAWLSEKIGEKQPTVHRWLKGERRPRDPRIFDRMIEVITGIGPSMTVTNYPQSIPLCNPVPASTWGDVLEIDDRLDVADNFAHPKNFATPIEGDCLMPALHPHDMAIWRHDHAPRPGVIVLAQRKGDHGATAKVLKYEDGRPHLMPLADGQEEPEDGMGWGVVARLIGVIRKEHTKTTIFHADTGLTPAALLE